MRKQFAVTANVKRYTTAVNAAVASPPGIDKFVIVTGEVGQGKTETSLWWKNTQSPHSVLVRVKKAMGPRWLLDNIATELGLMPAKRTQGLFDQIVETLPAPTLRIMSKYDFRTKVLTFDERKALDNSTDPNLVTMRNDIMAAAEVNLDEVAKYRALMLATGLTTEARVDEIIAGVRHT